jgi:hypothetical protein
VFLNAPTNGSSLVCCSPLERQTCSAAPGIELTLIVVIGVPGHETTITVEMPVKEK